MASNETDLTRRTTAGTACHESECLPRSTHGHQQHNINIHNQNNVLHHSSPCLQWIKTCSSGQITLYNGIN